MAGEKLETGELAPQELDRRTLIKSLPVEELCKVCHCEHDVTAVARDEIAPRILKMAKDTRCSFEVEVALTVKGTHKYINEKGETSICVGERSATLSGLRGNRDVLRAMIASLSAELYGQDPDFTADRD